MKVTYYRPYVFTLSEDDMVKATKQTLKALVHPGEYLRNVKGKMWLTRDDPNWRHDNVSEDYIREATELDLAVFTVLEVLK